MEQMEQLERWCRWSRWNGGADGNTPNGFLIFEKNFHGVRGVTVAEHAVRRTCLPPIDRSSSA